MAQLPPLMEPLEVQTQSPLDVQDVPRQWTRLLARTLSTVLAVALFVAMLTGVSIVPARSATPRGAASAAGLGLRHSIVKGVGVSVKPVAAYQPLVQFQPVAPFATKRNPQVWKLANHPGRRPNSITPPHASKASISSESPSGMRLRQKEPDRKPVVVAGPLFTKVPLPLNQPDDAATGGFNHEFWEYLQGHDHSEGWHNHWQQLLKSNHFDARDERKFWQNMLDTVVTDIRDFPEEVGHLRLPYLHDPATDKTMHDDETFWRFNDKDLLALPAGESQPFVMNAGRVFEEVHAPVSDGTQGTADAERILHLLKQSSDQYRSAVGNQSLIVTGALLSNTALFTAASEPPIGVTEEKPCNQAKDCDEDASISVIVGTSSLVSERPGLVKEIVRLVNSAYVTAAVDSGALLLQELQGRDLERVTENDIVQRLQMGDLEIMGTPEGVSQDIFQKIQRANRVLHLAFKGNALVGVISSAIQPPWTEEGVGHWGFLFVQPESTPTETYVFAATRHNKEKEIVAALINAAEERLASSESCKKIQIEYEHTATSTESEEYMRDWFAKRLGFQCSAGFAGGYRKASGTTLTKCQKPISAEMKARVAQQPFTEALSWEQANVKIFQQALATVTLRRRSDKDPGGKLVWVPMTKEDRTAVDTDDERSKRQVLNIPPDAKSALATGVILLIIGPLDDLLLMALAGRLARYLALKH